VVSSIVAKCNIVEDNIARDTTIRERAWRGCTDHRGGWDGGESITVVNVKLVGPLLVRGPRTELIRNVAITGECEKRVFVKSGGGSATAS